MTEEQAGNYRVNREGWSPGPWDDEPEDRVDFIHSGFACLCLRNDMGNWCGYVGVPEYHPILNLDLDSILNVHGGITYQKKCDGDICHVPRLGMPDEVVWIGFDCAHLGDAVPSRILLYDPLLPELRRVYGYRTVCYVKKQTKALAEQLAAYNGGMKALAT